METAQVGWTPEAKLMYDILLQLIKLGTLLGPGYGGGGSSLTTNQLAAINDANTPSAANVFATMADVGNITSQYVTYTDGISIFRQGVRDSHLYIDKTLTPTGFAGTEGLDWESVGSAI